MAFESNVNQDTAILRMMSELSSASHLQYAISLGKFLVLKQHIERELHADGSINERRQYLERLVDSVCHEVCLDIFRLSRANATVSDVLTGGSTNALRDLSAKLESGHARILHAYQTLSDIAAQLDVIMKPGATPEMNNEAEELDRILEVLKSETKIAQAVDDRIRSELPAIR